MRPFHLAMMGSQASRYQRSIWCFARVWGSSGQRVVLGTGTLDYRSAGSRSATGISFQVR